MENLRAGWVPDRLRERREAEGLTLEEAGRGLLGIAGRVQLKGISADTVRALRQHEQGEAYPGPHYRRAYCLLYGATEADLGFRSAIPGEEASADPTQPDNGTNGTNVSAVERAVHRIGPGSGSDGADSDGADHISLRQRIIGAWRHRYSSVPHRPVLLMVGGYAGSGKTELARFLVQLTGWPVLDKDPLTRPLVERLLVALGGDADDRRSDLYLDQVRPLEYECLMQSAMANLRAGVSTVLCAPFVAQMTDEAWMQRTTGQADAFGADVCPVWVRCDERSMQEHIVFRAAARDAWKIERWDEYMATVDLDLRPVVPHLVVDNRLGAAVNAADQARLAMGTPHPSA